MYNHTQNGLIAVQGRANNGDKSPEAEDSEYRLLNQILLRMNTTQCL
jgi:hypothetical protein